LNVITCAGVVSVLQSVLCNHDSKKDTLFIRI